MGWKEFLKPENRKLILDLIISIATVVIIHPLFFCAGGSPLGTPWYYCYYDIFGLSVGTLIFLIIFYIPSCLIIWIYDKVKKK